MKRKIVSIFVFLALLMTAFVIMPTNVIAEDEPDFGISVFPSSQTVAPGEYTTFVITLTSLNGFNSPVTLSASGLPDGAYAYFNPNPVTPTGNSVLTISTIEEVETGNFPITLTGTGGGITHTAATAITVDFGLIPMKFGTFTGQVTDMETEEGIAGATVFVNSAHVYYIHPDLRYWGKVIPEVTTNSDGYYTITGVPLNANNAPKDWVVGFHADGYSSTYHGATAVADTVVTVDMALCHNSITGWVVDADNDEPIPDANIIALSSIPGSYARAYSFTTDDEGYYTLLNLPLGEDNADRTYSIEVTHPDYCDQVQEDTISCGSSIELDFSLVPKLYGTFKGKVTDAGTGDPIVGAKVYIYYYDRPHQYLLIYPTYRTWYKLIEVTTDVNGDYIMNNVPLIPCNNPKEWVIGFHADGFSETYHIATAIANTEVIVDMAMCSANDITGTVINANTNEPIMGAEIYAYSHIRPYSYVIVRDFYTDEQGVYTLPNLALGEDNASRTYGIEVSHPDYYDSETQEATISCGISSSSDFALTPKLYGSFTGRVLDKETNEPIGGATVFIDPRYHTYWKYPSYSTWDKTIEATTDPDGYYTMTNNVPLDPINVPKDYMIGFHAEGYSSTYLGATAVADTVVTVDDIYLCHASITGKVIDASTGEPIAGAELYAWSYVGPRYDPFYIYSQAWIRDFTTDDEGVYTLPNIPLGYDNEPRPYNVRVTAEGYWPQIKTGTIFCGGTIIIDFAGPDIAFGTITGTVTDCLTGDPIAGAFIGSTFGVITYTDEDGSYTLTDIELGPGGSPKTGEVTAEAEGYESQTLPVEVNAEEPSILDFALCPPIQQYYLAVDTDPAGLTTFSEEGWYEQGTEVELNAPSIEGYTFLYWDVDGTNQGDGENPITVTMNSDHTATAHYFEWVIVSGHKYEDIDGTQPTTTPLGDWTMNLYSFCDDFEDEDDDGWEILSGTWNVIDDSGDWVYSGTATGDEQISYALSAGTYSDFTIEADLKAANSVGHYGIVLREDGSGNHYGFYLNAYTPSQGLYWFGYWDGSYHAIVGWTDSDGAYTDANTWNKVKVVANGYEFKLYINDILVNTVTDTTEYAASGYAGLIIDHYSGGYQNTYFDDVCIYDSTVTDSDGYYEFTIKNPGTYEVKEELQEGWTQTLPEDGYTITIDEEDAGTTIADQDFWNFEWFKIYGHKYFDGNGDSTWNNEEPYLDGWTINLDDTDSVITGDEGDTGYYEFTIKEPGTYMVSEDTSDIWIKTEPTGDYHEFVAQSGVDVELNFGNWFEGGFITDSSLCYFDVDDADGQQFRVIFTPDINNDPSLYKVSATNPGQFYYHVFYSGEDITGAFEITLADNFETQGATPVHVYSFLNAGPEGCLIPGNDVSDDFEIEIIENSITVTPNEEYDGFIYITVHCDYALKKTGGYELQYYDDEGVTRGHAIKDPDEESIYDMTSYTFSVNGPNSFEDQDTIQNRNEFKKFRGIVGFLTDSSGDPIINNDITITGPYIEGESITVQTDEDGFYGHSFFHQGKPKTYSVEFVGYTTIEITMKAGHFAEVSYQVP